MGNMLTKKDFNNIVAKLFLDGCNSIDSKLVMLLSEKLQHITNFTIQERHSECDVWHQAETEFYLAKNGFIGIIFDYNVVIDDYKNDINDVYKLFKQLEKKCQSILKGIECNE